MNLLQTITLAWTQYRAFQAALAELKSYSERELSELGITRADIPRLAYAEAERRVEALAPSRRHAQPARVVAEACSFLSPSFNLTEPIGALAAPPFFHDMEVHDAPQEHP